MKCPICNYQGKFQIFNNRKNAQCPDCYSLERHRLLWLYLKNKTDLLRDFDKKILHCSPQPALSKAFQEISHFGYVTINPVINSFNIDLQNLPFLNNYFDCVLAIHILVEVENDLKAMKEIYRVLKSQGFAILQVPLKRIRKTIERKNRPELFQNIYPQYIRMYGKDYKKRLKSVGFQVQVDNYVRQCNYQKYNLDQNEKIYVCRKQ